MEGFIVFDYASQYAHARADLAAWLSEGKIQRKETIVQGGLTKAGEALVSLYQGSNTGMCVCCSISSCTMSFWWKVLLTSDGWGVGKLLVEIVPHEETGKANL